MVKRIVNEQSPEDVMRQFQIQCPRCKSCNGLKHPKQYHLVSWLNEKKVKPSAIEFLSSQFCTCWLKAYGPFGPTR